MNEISEAQIYDAIGEEGFRRFVSAFYRQIPDDDILGPMYPADDLSGAEDRLRGFLIFRLGGPQAYIAERGHPRLRMRHAPFDINQAARDRWVELMMKAIDEASLPTNVVSILKPFLQHVATLLINQSD